MGLARAPYTSSPGWTFWTGNFFDSDSNEWKYNTEDPADCPADDDTGDDNTGDDAVSDFCQSCGGSEFCLAEGPRHPELCQTNTGDQPFVFEHWDSDKSAGVHDYTTHTTESVDQLLLAVLLAYGWEGRRKRRSTAEDSFSILSLTADQGCWCPTVIGWASNPVEAAGTPKNDYDKACRDLQACKSRAV